MKTKILLKYILILMFIVGCSSILGFVMLPTNVDINTFKHLLGLSFSVPFTITYIIILIFLSKTEPQNIIARPIHLNQSFLILLIAGCMFFTFLPIYEWENLMLSEFTPQQFSNEKNDSFFILYRIIPALIIAPIFEEILFRGYFYSRLKVYFSTNLSITISSILFSFSHIVSPKALIPSFLLGIINCKLYSISNNLSHPILLHFIINLIWAITVLYPMTYFQLISFIGFKFLFWLLVVSATILLLYIYNKMSELF